MYRAFRLGNVAFVVFNDTVIVQANFETFEAARRAVTDFNAGKHETVGHN